MADPVTEFEQYRQELLAALANDDPVAVLRASLDEVPRLVAAAAAGQLNQSPAPGEWSPREVLNHLADSDLVHATRVRMIVTQDLPTIVGYDQEAWAARFRALVACDEEFLERFRLEEDQLAPLFGQARAVVRQRQVMVAQPLAHVPRQDRQTRQRD